MFILASDVLYKRISLSTVVVKPHHLREALFIRDLSCLTIRLIIIISAVVANISR